MTTLLLARRLARVLALGLPDEVSLPDDRDATVRAMQRALRARRVGRRRTRWLGGVAAAAAIALGAFGALRHPTPGATAAPALPAPAEVLAEHVAGGVLVLSGGHTDPLRDTRAVGAGDHVLALLDGQATLALASGTRLSVAGGGDVALLSGGPTQIFELHTGSVRADVAKLRAGERFVIRTADAEVEVRGTSFRVGIAPPDPACGNGTTTRVEVFEGVVTIRSGTTEAAVHPGESWPPGCAPAIAPANAPSSPDRAAASTLSSSSAVRPSALGVAAPQSELAAQNDLFDQAMLAKRRGDIRAAIASFDRLLSRYPVCPFAESAAAERMKLLAETDRARAADVARDYLRRYPKGFAHTDAEALLH
jgi:hypothetical protein